MINMTSRNGSEIRFNGSCMLYSILFQFTYVWQLYAIFYFLAIHLCMAVVCYILFSCSCMAVVAFCTFCTFLYGSCSFLYLSVLFCRRTLSVAFL